MAATALAEGRLQRVASARMNKALGQKRHARGASPRALPQATVSGGLRPHRIIAYLRTNAQQLNR